MYKIKIYIQYIKVQQVKESNRGKLNSHYKNCPPKRKDKTIKNRKLIHKYTSPDTKRKKKTTTTTKSTTQILNKNENPNSVGSNN